MTQTKIPTQADADILNDNLSILYGLIRTVKHYLDFVGILPYLRTLKAKGVRLDSIVVALCVFTMYASNSLNACANWLKDDEVRRLLGFRTKDKVSQRTLNRAIAILGRNREGVIVALWEGIKKRFEIDEYDINLDGSSVVLYGPKSEYGEKGYDKDKNRGRLQVEFMVAQLASMGIPIYIKPYGGSVSDEAQYRDCVPELGGLIGFGDLHALDELKEESEENKGAGEPDLMTAVAAVSMLGAAIVADNGAASESNTKRMENSGFDYLTRVQMNKSDDKRIEDHISDFEYLGDGMFCYAHTFASSGRTTYLYFSRDLFMRSRHKAEERIERNLRTLDDVRSGKLRKSDFVTIHGVPWVSVEVKVTAQMSLTPYDWVDKARLVREHMGFRAGFFKLESSRQMTPEEALRKYRRRVGVEHVISSLKRITGIKPIRVWNRESVDGCMTLALLAEAAVAMARHCMDGVSEETSDIVEEDRPKNGPSVKPSKPNSESIVRSLVHLTLTKYRSSNGRWKLVTSNWEPISTEIMTNIRLHEDPKWGNRKVPAQG